MSWLSQIANFMKREVVFLQHKLKYIVFAAAMLCIPLFIDNVYASSGVYWPGIGTFNHYLYWGNEIHNSKDYLAYTAIGGKAFDVFSYNFTEFYAPNKALLDRLTWTFPGSVIQGYDSMGFTVGFNPGYVNNMMFHLSGEGYSSGWIQCNAISLPGSGNDYGIQFSSFTCSFDGKNIDSSKTYTLHVESSAIVSYSPSYNNQFVPKAYNPAFYFGTDIILYNDFENSVSISLKEQTDAINKQTESFDEFKNTDIDDSNKELPDNSNFDDYEASEGELLDSISDVDMNSLNIGIDSNSSNFVWDTTTRLIQSHPAVFGMFISILSIGIIKLALGR